MCFICGKSWDLHTLWFQVLNKSKIYEIWNLISTLVWIVLTYICYFLKISCNAARNTLQNTACNTCHSAIWKVANGRFFFLFFSITFLFWNPVHENIALISKSWIYSWKADQSFFFYFLIIINFFFFAMLL